MNRRRVLLLLLTLARLPASTAEALPAQLAAEPNYCLDVEFASVEGGVLPTAPYFLVGGRLARLACSIGRVRVGTAYFEGWSPVQGGDPSIMGGPVPLCLDVNLYRRSAHIGRFHASFPDIYLSAAFVPAWSPLSTCKVGITCDYACGMGLGLEAFYVHGVDRWERNVNQFCIGLRLSVLVARIGLGD